MTDDPSTNSGEWVCAYADTEPCGPEDWNDVQATAGLGCGYVTPSPVPDSERPACNRCGGKGYEPSPTGIPQIGAPSCMACFGSGTDRKAREADAPFSNPDLSAAWAYGWNSYSVAHRCPTPEPTNEGCDHGLTYGITADFCPECTHVICPHCDAARPTPEGDQLAELRTARDRVLAASSGTTFDHGYYTESVALFYKAVDRLLASHPGGEA